jgi:hypothetical protein
VAAGLFVYSGYMIVGATLSSRRKRRASTRTVRGRAGTVQAH